MAAAGAIGTVAGAGIKAYAAIRDGNLKAAAEDANAQSAEQNAQLTEMQAAEEERRQRILARKQIGDMRANYAASGVTLEGSPMEVLEESAMQAELDALTIKYMGKTRATQYRNQAAFSRYASKEYKFGGRLSAAGSILGGVGGLLPAGSRTE